MFKIDSFYANAFQISEILASTLHEFLTTAYDSLNTYQTDYVLWRLSQNLLHS